MKHPSAWNTRTATLQRSAPHERAELRDWFEWQMSCDYHFMKDSCNTSDHSERLTKLPRTDARFGRRNGRTTEETWLSVEGTRRDTPRYFERHARWTR